MRLIAPTNIRASSPSPITRVGHDSTQSARLFVRDPPTSDEVAAAEGQQNVGRLTNQQRAKDAAGGQFRGHGLDQDRPAPGLEDDRGQHSDQGHGQPSQSNLAPAAEKGPKIHVPHRQEEQA